VDSVTLGGAGALLLALFGYLFKEIRRKDEGVWLLVADRDKRILDLEDERDHWRAAALGQPPPPRRSPPPIEPPAPQPSKRRTRRRD
jgi:hypothetical protein